MTIPVACFRILEYESALLDRAVDALLSECLPPVAPGTRVLVKPNLISRVNASLSCTNPLVVRAVCARLLDRGARVVVGDSPAFGSARQVASANGLRQALEPLGVPLATLGRPAQRPLSFGGTIGISRTALEQDLIVNLPRLKAHAQFRITGAVKNLFGCVVGFRKALAHTRHGEYPGRLAAVLADVMAALPDTVALMDAVHPMHGTGPIKGEPFHLGLLAASPDSAALDTLASTLLGLTPEELPLWAELRRRGLPGAFAENLEFPLESPDGFDASGFRLPEKLDAMEFEPVRFVRGRVRSLLDHFRR